MKSTTIYTKLSTGMLALLLPFMLSCSILGGNNYSDSPAVAAQQQQVESLKAELREAERNADEAEERAKAAKNRLKAAEHELKAVKSQAKSHGY